jgi:hypothetical protein
MAGHRANPPSTLNIPYFGFIYVERPHVHARHGGSEYVKYCILVTTLPFLVGLVYVIALFHQW